jgi:hypothetical protein
MINFPETAGLAQGAGEVKRRSRVALVSSSPVMHEIQDFHNQSNPPCVWTLEFHSSNWLGDGILIAL